MRHYLEQFVEVVAGAYDMELLGGTVAINEGTVNELQGVYRQLHEMHVAEGGAEMHLDFIMYVSVLEEKCLCHIFARIHSADAQGQHYRECENRATNAAMDILSSRFVASREVFLQRYGLNAVELGFPY